jgi:hypothetical protein
MTMPNEMFQAIRNARHFMLALMDPKQTPKIPKEIRKRARDRLKHFPSEYEINELEKLHSAQDTDPNVLLQECMKRLDSVRGTLILSERKVEEVGNAIIHTINGSKQ